MRTILFAILCILLSEVAFLLGYWLTYAAYTCANLALAILGIGLPPKALSWLVGLACGLAAGFCALSVALVFSKISGVTDTWFLVLSMGLPAAGFISYLGRSLRQVVTGQFRPSTLYETLHHTVMAMPQRMQFEYTKSVLEQSHPEQVGLAGDPLGHLAYRASIIYVFTITIASVPGVIGGILLAYEVFGR